MKVIGVKVPEIKRILNFIQKRHGDCECLCGKKEWYGKQISCGTLFASYGVIGYSIEYDGYDIKVDNELNEVVINDGSYEELACLLDSCGVIEDIPELIEEFTGITPEITEDSIDDGCADGSRNKYVMQRCFLLKDNVYVDVYYGDVDRKVGCVTVSE